MDGALKKIGHFFTQIINLREKNAVQIQEISPRPLSKLLIILQNFVHSSFIEVVSRKGVRMMQCAG